MAIKITGRSLNIPISDRIVGHEGDNLIETRTFELNRYYSNIDMSVFDFKLDTQVGDVKNTIDLDKTVSEDKIILTWIIEKSHVLYSGYMAIQIRAFSGNEEIWHSTQEYVQVLPSINATESQPDPLPSEFAQMEQRITAMRNEATAAAQTATEQAGIVREIVERAESEVLPELTQAIVDAGQAKGLLDGSIEAAGTAKTTLDGSISAANTAKTNLEGTITQAGTAKGQLEGTITSANDVKGALDGSITTAGQVKNALDESIATGDIAAFRAEFESHKNDFSTEVDRLDNRIDTIITTPAESVSAEEIIDARDGETSLGAKIRNIDRQLNDISTLPSILVASADAPEKIKQNADYVLPGINDGYYINNTILPNIPESGAVLEFATGTILLDQAIANNTINNLVIRGQGDATIFKIADVIETTLADQAVSGQKNITVVDATGFTVGQQVFIGIGDGESTQWEINRIVNINDNLITVESNLKNTYEQGSLFYSCFHAFEAKELTGLVFDNFYIDGNKENQLYWSQYDTAPAAGMTFKVQNGVFLDGCSKSYVKNIHINNLAGWGGVVFYNGTTFSTVQDCIVENTRRHGFISYFNANSFNSWINCVGISNGDSDLPATRHNFIVEDSSHLTSIGCKSLNGLVDGLYIYNSSYLDFVNFYSYNDAVAIMIPDSPVKGAYDGNSSNISFASCSFISTQTIAGVNIQSVTGLRFDNCRFWGVTCSLTSHYGDTVANITGCYFKMLTISTKTRALILYGNTTDLGKFYVTINGCTFDAIDDTEPTSAFVYLKDVTGGKVAIQNNLFLGCIASQLLFNVVNDIFITDNIFDGKSVCQLAFNYMTELPGANCYARRNVFTGFTGNPILSNLLGFMMKDNIGYKTEASGTNTIWSGSTSVVIYTGLNKPVELKDIKVTPTNNLGNATKFWIGNVTTTQFTIYVDKDPGPGHATFCWSVT